MATLSYSGITIPYCQTTSFKQEVVYDDLSNTDWICTKFDIQVTGILNMDVLDQISGELSAGDAKSPAAIMKAIRSIMLRTRRTLSVIHNGVELIPNRADVAGTVDAMNGPKPQSCSVTQLTELTFFIQFHVIAHYWENNNLVGGSGLDVTNVRGHKVLYNRWSETVEIDKMQMSTRIREGKYMIRSDNAEGKIADEVRTSMAILGVPKGFLRESSKYVQSPDGLAITYTIVDKEQTKMPPKGVYEASGTYTEHTTRLGAKRKGTVHVRLEGSPDRVASPQEELVKMAMYICSQKLTINTRPPTDVAAGVGSPPARVACIVESAEITVDMYKNVVDMRVTANFPVYKRDKKAGIGLVVGEREYIMPICKTPFSEPDSGGSGAAPDGPTYKIRGGYGLLLQAAKYYDPSLTDTGMGPGDVVSEDNPSTTTTTSQLTRGVKVGRAGVEVEP